MEAILEPQLRTRVKGVLNPTNSCRLHLWICPNERTDGRPKSGRQVWNRTELEVELSSQQFENYSETG